MSALHDVEHELVLASLFAGELGRDAPEVQSLLNACSTCRQQIQDLADVSERLAESAAERSADLAAAARLGPDPVEPRLQERLAELARVAPLRSRRNLAWLAAAALLLAGALLWRVLAPETTPRPPLPLGSGDEDQWELEGPRGASDFARFAWRYHGRASGFVLRIHDADAPDSRPREFRCKESSWIPDAVTVQELPTRIRWEVDALGAAGTADDWLSTSPSASAWRSR